MILEQALVTAYLEEKNMNIKIAENLKAFRRERGNTQEELSNHLGISIQAVSKWERNEGYPDITLLPMIAAYYEKTVDELLGCGEIEQSRRIEEVWKQYKEKWNEGRIEDAISLMRGALKEFPHNLSFLSELAQSLLYSGNKEYLDECIRLCEKVLEKSVNDEQRYHVLNTIVHAYGKKQDIEKAKGYAEKLPGIICSKDIMLIDVLKGEECVKLAQQNIMTMVNLIDNCVMYMLFSGEYTPQQRIFAFETVDKLYNLFLYDGNYGMENASLSTLWMYLAREYAACGDQEKTIQALKTSYKYSFERDHLKAGSYTSIFADTGSYSGKNFFNDSEKTSVEGLKAVMQDEVFDFVRETDAFREIMEA